ncbi:hypothetical protein UFOVP579_29 [uncultured Caudovirales phage]|uniref:DUF5681 domain-containing protein n=1 Tax=uncultured Caudovirales phage TaxID=2100421 RepID=A0A6J5PBX3_9CAUD|nr:hypothetical protein UFOVP302_29 [uncultured Caudovirales phage]CAB4168707.1 hypothetical protein UFOVP579_29 [uncultured Caudovirales phage]
MPFKKGNKLAPKPFVKGKSGNPKGKPKKLPHLDKLLAEVLGEEKDGMTAAEAILKALRVKATKGDIRAAEVLLDRGYGKVKETINLTSKVITVRVPGEEGAES